MDTVRGIADDSAAFQRFMTVIKTNHAEPEVVRVTHIFDVDVSRYPDGVWFAQCDRLNMILDDETLDDLVKRATEIATDMAIELNIVSPNETIGINFIQRQLVNTAMHPHSMSLKRSKLPL
ncbi:MAG: DUF1902 domain-containing protein [Burkholderiaceae bacterium]|jgi:hypothetical protein|nr:DUF1902 domain-containing protein [Burkholderiaceae bacterium]